MFWGEPKIGLRGFRHGFRIISGIEIVIINVLIFEIKGEHRPKLGLIVMSLTRTDVDVDGCEPFHSHKFKHA